MLRRRALQASAAAGAAAALAVQQYSDYINLVDGSAVAELHLPLSAEAQKTEVVRVRGFLSPAEVDDLHALHSELKPRLGSAGRNSSNQAAAYRQGSWETTYLSTDGLFAQERPALRDRIVELAREVDAQHWHVMNRATQLVVPRWHVAAAAPRLPVSFLSCGRVRRGGPQRRIPHRRARWLVAVPDALRQRLVRAAPRN